MTNVTDKHLFNYLAYLCSVTDNVILALCLVPFRSYLTLNNIVTLKCGLEVTEAY